MESGYAQRIHDYEKIRDLARSMKTVEEKIDMTTPYERDWTKLDIFWKRSIKIFKFKMI